MSPDLKITVEGADEAATAIRAVGDRIGASLRPFFEVLGADWEAAFQGRIDKEGGESPWPPMSATRARIRARSQTPGSFPLLRETGDLRASILSEITDETLAVGTNLPYAALLHFGGTTAPGSAVPGASVPPRPFVYLTNEQVYDAIEMLYDWLLEGDLPRA
ncbi:MAG TPA: phage virion morphogenesis protein [Thermoanaerobaculia bacterium]|nr:MAG: Phage virion morphogenesis family protein [Acidobacteria bacterium ADurb.Bin051]HNU81943.1 phage virion morphogenesis protein [Thermoanaerobaculia bacterium]